MESQLSIPLRLSDPLLSVFCS